MKQSELKIANQYLNEELVKNNTRISELSDHCRNLEKLVLKKSKVISLNEKLIKKLESKKTKAIDWAKLRNDQVGQLINTLENQSKIDLKKSTSLDLNNLVNSFTNILGKK